MGASPHTAADACPGAQCTCMPAVQGCRSGGEGLLLRLLTQLLEQRGAEVALAIRGDDHLQQPGGLRSSNAYVQVQGGSGDS